MYQVQYFAKGKWVDWAQAPTSAVALKYESILKQRFKTRIFKIVPDA